VKIRFRDDSIRLRLSQREVAALAGGSAVESQTHFARGPMLLCRIAPEGAAIAAEFGNCAITVHLPQPVVTHWAGSDSLAIEGEDGPLRIAVEKDLECRHARPGEDDSDAFPAQMS
jgi:hypothetical protein